MSLMTHDDIKELGPDRKAYAAAKKVAVPASWTQLGKHGSILWGLATGSSGDAYYVHVDAGARVLDCSCPSRKRPCKHTLAILILDADGHAFPDAPVPSGHLYEAQTRYTSSWE